MMNQPAIYCKKIKKSYGDDDTKIDALKGIDLKIDKKLTLLVGPSGSGKTTLLSVLTTLLKPDAGELFLLGHDMSRMSENEKAQFRRDHLGIVFQSLFLIPTLTAAENVSLPLFVSGWNQQKATHKAMEALEKMNLTHRSHSSPAHLSKGQQQRVAIARAIVNNSKILVCDEPTSSLDQAAGLEIMALLKELSQDPSRTIFVVTHDQRTFSFADRIININDGQIVAGSKHE